MQLRDLLLVTNHPAAAQSPAAEGEVARSPPRGAVGAAISGRACPLLLDVRPATQVAVMALPGVVAVPFEQVEQRMTELLQLCGAGGGEGGCGGEAEGAAAGGDGAGAGGQPGSGVGGAAASGLEGTGAGAGGAEGQGRAVSPPRLVVLCRRGNNSQRVAARLRALGGRGVTDLVGGYQGWAREVDPAMPLL